MSGDMAYAPILAKCMTSDSMEPSFTEEDDMEANDLKQKAFERGANMFSNAGVKCRFLEKALMYSAEQHALAAGRRSNLPSTFPLPRKSTQRSSHPAVSSQLTRKFSLMSIGMSVGVGGRSTQTAATYESEEDTFAGMDEIKRLFLPESVRHVHPQHTRLARVVRHVFSTDMDDEISQSLVRVSDTTKKVGKLVEQLASFVPPVSNPVMKAKVNFSEKLRRFFSEWLRGWARRLINNSVVSSFFFSLTVYVLFGPDLVVRYGNKDCDFAFMVINTVIFFFFVLEVILSLLGRKDYVFSPLILDLVALISLLGDTWFFQGGSGGDSVQDRLVVARSSRLTRLTRIVRIARVTRLVPHLMKLMSRKSMEFSKAILEKKLWRVFLFLDTDFDGMVSNFDLKCFYMVLLQQESLVRGTPQELLQADVDALVRIPEREDAVTAEFSPRLDFAEFYRVIQDTTAGQNVLQSLHERVFHAAGVATLTQRISDSVAMKICIGIVLTAMVMQAYPGHVEDQTVQQVLQMLVVSARFEHSRGIESAYTELCKQVASVGHHAKLLFLHLEGWTYLDAGQCHAGISAAVMKPFDRISSIIDELNLRETQVMTFCWPDFKDCSVQGTSSVVLVDTTRQVHDAAVTSIMQTITLIVLLLVFAYFFNYFIGRFSKRLLQPLQAFVDDMTAMSCLELVQLDLESREPPVPHKKPGENYLLAFVRQGGADVLNRMHGGSIKMVDELDALQKAFGHMKGAVRSWSKYVPPAVVQCLFDAGMEATVGVTKCHVSILFCDIDDFDQQICNSPAEEVMSLLTKVLGAIADVIENNSGTLLEFIGDETLAAFNAPCPVRHHVHAAARAALEIHEAIDSLPQLHTLQEVNGRRQLVETNIRCRCGVHTAMILAGNIGSQNRMKYGMLGDGVNLTARLKGLNTKYRTKTLSTDKVLANEACRHSFLARPVDRVAVKGRSEPTTVYEMLGFLHRKEMEHYQVLAKKHTDAFRLYQRQCFAEAKVLLHDVSEGFQAQGHIDEPSLQLARRCDRYLAEPPPEGWDGVERLKAKLFQVEEAPKAEPKVDPEAEPQDETKGEISKDSTEKPKLGLEPRQKDDALPPSLAPEDKPPHAEEPEPPSDEAPLLPTGKPSADLMMTVASVTSDDEEAETGSTTLATTEGCSATKLVAIPGCID